MTNYQEASEKLQRYKPVYAHLYSGKIVRVLRLKPIKKEIIGFDRKRYNQYQIKEFRF
jgi:hypothetical protein